MFQVGSVAPDAFAQPLLSGMHFLMTAHRFHFERISLGQVVDHIAARRGRTL